MSAAVHSASSLLMVFDTYQRTFSSLNQGILYLFGVGDPPHFASLPVSSSRIHNQRRQEEIYRQQQQSSTSHGAEPKQTDEPSAGSEQTTTSSYAGRRQKERQQQEEKQEQEEQQQRMQQQKIENERRELEERLRPPALLITGCTSGIGKHLAFHFWRKGYVVYATYRQEIDHQKMLQEARHLAAIQHPPKRILFQSAFPEQLDINRYIPIRMDVTDVSTIDHAFQIIQSDIHQGNISGLHGLVNNAGQFPLSPIETCTDREILYTFEINLFGPLALMRTFLPLLKISKGRIVNIGSVASFFCLPGTGLFSSSKAALAALTRSLRRELKYLDVCVSLVEPGIINTETYDKLLSGLMSNERDVQPTSTFTSSLACTSSTRTEGKRGQVDTGTVTSTVSNSPHSSKQPHDVSEIEQQQHDEYERIVSRTQFLFSQLRKNWIRLVKMSRKLAFPTEHVVHAVEHALTALYPQERYLVGWDAKLNSWMDRMMPGFIQELITRGLFGSSSHSSH